MVCELVKWSRRHQHRCGDLLILVTRATAVEATMALVDAPEGVAVDFISAISTSPIPGTTGCANRDILWTQWEPP